MVKVTNYNFYSELNYFEQDCIIIIYTRNLIIFEIVRSFGIISSLLIKVIYYYLYIFFYYNKVLIRKKVIFKKLIDIV